MNEIICGDALLELKKLPSESVSCVITSPPYYGLRDYQTAKWEYGITHPLVREYLYPETVFAKGFRLKYRPNLDFHLAKMANRHPSEAGVPRCISRDPAPWPA